MTPPCRIRGNDEIILTKEQIEEIDKLNLDLSFAQRKPISYRSRGWSARDKEN